MAGALAATGVATLLLAFRPASSPEPSAPPQTAGSARLVDVRRFPAVVAEAVGAQRLDAALGRIAGGTDACWTVDDAGTPIVDHDPDRALRPASTLKMVTAAAALEAGIAALGAARIALLCPYPEALCAASLAWWQRRGVSVVQSVRLPTPTADTRGIYALTSAAAAGPLAALRAAAVDAVVISGTGLPSLSLLAAAMDDTGPPVVSSNLCLVWELLRRSGREALAGAEPRQIRGWRERHRQGEGEGAG